MTEAGRTDPVLSAAPDEFPIMQWHSDTFTLPPGTVHLAGSTRAPVQSYRYGRAGYGMQFHFEANRAVVSDWTREFGAMMEANRPGWIARLDDHAAGDGALADAHGLAIARAWVKLI
jgi:GMP synthase (glutamine-hydrolysing)